jgi:hypothetical protein
VRESIEAAANENNSTLAVKIVGLLVTVKSSERVIGADTGSCSKCSSSDEMLLVCSILFDKDMTATYNKIFFL